MKALIALFAVLTLPLLAVAQQQTGATGLDLSAPSQIAPPAPAIQGSIPIAAPRILPSPRATDETDDWQLYTTDSLTAQIPAGGQMAVWFDPLTHQLGFVNPTQTLSATQEAAIARAPAWLRADLRDNFRRFLYPEIADMVAQAVLNAVDPYVDEVAFQAAHIAPGVLGGAMYLQLLQENARYVYTADSALNYVQIVDYGNSSNNDYWSTARYRVVEASGDTVQFEIDRDTYYWNVVHPKLSDELPTYINPNTGQPADPPVGVFWRTYYWTHADSAYPLLATYFGNCNILWAHLTNTSGPANGAVGLMNNWINTVMHWGAGAERPIQPVRIYNLHCGNCGEYQDITAAAGRTALIPTQSPSALCQDHVWNEFWDRQWYHWEPVNNMVNSPLTYENGWGKVFDAVFDWRGDGYVWDVVQRYSTGLCTLNVVIHDAAGKPADGTVVTLKSDALWGGLYNSTWGVTNSSGLARFILGDSRNFYLRLDGPLGYYPGIIAVTQIISNSQAGMTYTWEHTMTQSSPTLAITPAPPYANPLDDYRMEINFQVNYETAYGTYFSNNQFALKTPTGYTDFFMVNPTNYHNYLASIPAQGFDILDNATADTVSYTLPTNERWYGVFSARELSLNRPMVKVVVKVYHNVMPLEVTITPVNPLIIIPANGGSFQFNASVINNGPTQQPFTIWTRIFPPGGGYPIIPIGPLLINPPVGVTVNRLRTQSVPSTWPPGEYSYNGYAAWSYPGPVVDSSFFNFTKSTTSDGGPIVFEASCTGEPFPGEVAVSLQPSAFSLFGASPNPFNPTTAIIYQLSADSRVSLRVYDTAGRQVTTLVDGWLEAGTHEATFDGSKLVSGLYFVRMQAGEFTATKKMMLVK